MAETDPLLEATGLVRNFSGIRAISELSFQVTEGSIKSVIGPNGAGKTTLINLITGVLKPSAGRITLQGRSIGGLPSYEVACLGVSRTFQTLELFADMTVLENVMVGCHRRSRMEIVQSAFRLPGVKQEERNILEWSHQQLERVGLAQQADRKAGTLPLGEQKLLEMARALAGSPQLLLLDEPAAGLNETETWRATKLIDQIRGSGITVILVEHDMKVVMSISDEIMVINYGQKIAEGPPEMIRTDPKVIEAYLGRSSGAAAAYNAAGRHPRETA